MPINLFVRDRMYSVFCHYSKIRDGQEKVGRGKKVKITKEKRKGKQDSSRLKQHLGGSTISIHIIHYQPSSQFTSYLAPPISTPTISWPFSERISSRKRIFPHLPAGLFFFKSVTQMLPTSSTGPLCPLFLLPILRFSP